MANPSVLVGDSSLDQSSQWCSGDQNRLATISVIHGEAGRLILLSRLTNIPVIHVNVPVMHGVVGDNHRLLAFAGVVLPILLDVSIGQRGGRELDVASGRVRRRDPFKPGIDPADAGAGALDLTGAGAHALVVETELRFGIDVDHYAVGIRDAVVATHL